MATDRRLYVAPNIAKLPHKAWLFVDDLLAALCRSAGGEQLAIMAIFFCGISAPISWKKAQFQDQINWCGWSVHFGHDTIHLMEAKLHKLRQQLENLSQAHKVPRKALEQCLGLLIWATSISKHSRPWLAPLYSDLHSPPGSMYSVSVLFIQLGLDGSRNPHHARPMDPNTR